MSPEDERNGGHGKLPAEGGDGFEFFIDLFFEVEGIQIFFLLLE